MAQRDTPTTDAGASGDGLHRRDFIKRSAVAGALVWAAPQIVSAPPAFAAGSPGPCDVPFEDDFESYSGGGGWTNDYKTIANGATFGAWTVTRGNVDLIRNNQHGACDGTAVDLHGTDEGPGRIELTGVVIDTVVGTTYRLKFDLGQNLSGNTARVVFGEASQDFAAPAMGSCAQKTMEFTATAATQLVVTFEDLDSLSSRDNAGAVIDNVVIEECPALIG